MYDLVAFSHVEKHLMHTPQQMETPQDDRSIPYKKRNIQSQVQWQIQLQSPSEFLKTKKTLVTIM